MARLCRWRSPCFEHSARLLAVSPNVVAESLAMKTADVERIYFLHLNTKQCTTQKDVILLAELQETIFAYRGIVLNIA